MKPSSCPSINHADGIAIRASGSSGSSGPSVARGASGVRGVTFSGPRPRDPGTRVFPRALALALAGFVLLAADAGAAVPGNGDATFDFMARPVRSVVRAGVPVGVIVAWPVSTSPSDPDKWLDCDGTRVNAADYPELVAVLTGSASATTATVPDLRGLFLRGHGSQAHMKVNGWVQGNTITVHASGNLGEVQGDAIREIHGTLPLGHELPRGEWFLDTFGGAFGWRLPMDADGIAEGERNRVQTYFSASRVVPTANEIRPVNRAVRYLMRARP